MRALAVIWAAAVWVTVPGAVAHAQEAARFLAAAEDVPLMSELAEIRPPVVFESPMGVVIRSEASGVADAVRVRRFYAETLPALGWLPDGPDRFMREAQHLTLSIRPLGADQPDRLVVAFTLVEAGPVSDTGARE